MGLFDGDFVSHAPEEESYIFFAEDHNHDYFCRIKRSVLEKLAIKYIMGANTDKVTLMLPTTICKGTPAWSKGCDIYHQVAIGQRTFTLTCMSNASKAMSGTYDMQWNIRIHNDK